jgi:hypothetical protein
VWQIEEGEIDTERLQARTRDAHVRACFVLRAAMEGWMHASACALLCSEQS